MPKKLSIKIQIFFEMKKFIFYFMLVVLSTGFKPTISKAQGWEAAVPVVIAGASYLSSHWGDITGLWTKAVWIAEGCPHTDIVAYFEDGQYFMDNPRSYRSPNEVLQGMFERYPGHGKIVDLQFNLGGRWRSVINSSEFSGGCKFEAPKTSERKEPGYSGKI